MRNISITFKNLDRNSIGYEINEDVLSVIKEKLGIAQESLFKEVGFEICTQADIRIDSREEINKLPYIFRDPIKFDKKIDPKKMQFGSKIDNSRLKAARRCRRNPRVPLSALSGI